MTLSPGSRLGPYQKSSPCLDRAAWARSTGREMIRVWHRRVALKILPETVARETLRRERFEREAQAIAALSHPNIVTIYSVEEDEGVPFLAMELVEGRPLSELIPAGWSADRRVLELAIPLADAIARGAQHAASRIAISSPTTS